MGVEEQPRTLDRVARDADEARLLDVLLPVLVGIEHACDLAGIVMLDHLPVTPNGKLDRRALPAPDLTAYATRKFEPPQGALEEIVAGVWQALLHIEKVGRRDNFFELGGHSLLAVTLVERMRRTGLQVDVKALFATPTIAALASCLSEPVIEVPPNLIPDINTEPFNSLEKTELRL